MPTLRLPCSCDGDGALPYPSCSIRRQRGGAAGSGGESYQQLLGTENDERDVSPPGSPALRGFRRQKRRMSKNIGGGVENLWKAVSSRLKIFFPERCLEAKDCCIALVGARPGVTRRSD